MIQIRHEHYVHPSDVALAGTARGPLADPDDAVHDDYVDQARAWLGQYLIGEYNRMSAADTARRRDAYTAARHTGADDTTARAAMPAPAYVGYRDPVITPITEPHVTADGTVYEVGWIGTLDVLEPADLDEAATT